MFGSLHFPEGCLRAAAALLFCHVPATTADNKHSSSLQRKRVSATGDFNEEMWRISKLWRSPKLWRKLQLSKSTFGWQSLHVPTSEAVGRGRSSGPWRRGAKRATFWVQNRFWVCPQASAPSLVLRVLVMTWEVPLVGAGVRQLGNYGSFEG